MLAIAAFSIPSQKKIISLRFRHLTAGLIFCFQNINSRLMHSLYDINFLAVLIINFVSRNLATSTTASLSFLGASRNFRG